MNKTLFTIQFGYICMPSYASRLALQQVAQYVLSFYPPFNIDNPFTNNFNPICILQSKSWASVPPPFTCQHSRPGHII